MSSQSDGAAWLRGAGRAARREVAEGGAHRPSKAGKLRDRLIPTPTGQQWQIAGTALDSAPTAATQSADTSDAMSADSRDRYDAQAGTQAKQETTGTTLEAPTAATLPTLGAATDTTAPTLSGDAALVEELRDQVKFLRSALEARDRDAAELRAALREALKMSQKALPQSTLVDAPNQAETGRQPPQISATTKEASTPPNAPQRQTQRGFRGWLLKYLQG